jgi:HAD superfamily hydrolase (TIGR01662 family)
MRGIVFLDRDGTLIEEVGYLRDPSAVRILPGAAEGLRLLAREGFLLAVVSNQAGLAKGKFTGEEMEAVHRRFVSAFGAEGSRSTRSSIARTTRKGRWRRTGERADAGSRGRGWPRGSFCGSGCRIRAPASWSVIK